MYLSLVSDTSLRSQVLIKELDFIMMDGYNGGVQFGGTFPSNTTPLRQDVDDSMIANRKGLA